MEELNRWLLSSGSMIIIMKVINFCNQVLRNVRVLIKIEWKNKLNRKIKILIRIF